MADPITVDPTPNLILRVRRLIADIEPIVSGTANYVFSDAELFEYLKDSVDFVAMDINEDYYITSAELFNATPTKSVQALIALKSAVMVREQLAEEGYKDGIYIRDGDTVIDTTRVLQQRGLGLLKLSTDYDKYVTKYLMGQDVGNLVNTYNYASTLALSSGV